MPEISVCRAANVDDYIGAWHFIDEKRKRFNRYENVNK